jgi:hypothetical protein
MDDEIAMATLLERMADWVRGERPEPYPLAEGAQDQQVALAIEHQRYDDHYHSRGLEPSARPSVPAGWLMAAAPSHSVRRLD